MENKGVNKLLIKIGDISFFCNKWGRDFVSYILTNERISDIMRADLENDGSNGCVM